MTNEITITYGENISAKVELPDRSNLIIGAPCCGGNAKATSPKDLFATSYGSCVIMSMGVSAKKSGFDIVGAKIVVRPVWAKDKPLLAEVNATVVLPSQLTEDKLDTLRKGVHNCPIHNSLRPEVTTTLTFEAS